MLSTASAVTWLAALVAATGASHAAMPTTSSDGLLAALRTQAGAQMRRAQVELYCDHPARALVAIRRAVEQLEIPSDLVASVELATLERAAWHVRRHETSAAVAALDLAMTRLSA